jgi:hypothetical protein
MTLGNAAAGKVRLIAARLPARHCQVGSDLSARLHCFS